MGRSVRDWIFGVNTPPPTNNGVALGFAPDPVAQQPLLLPVGGPPRSGLPNNSEPQAPVVVMLDFSPSMADRLADLRATKTRFITEAKADAMVSVRGWIEFVAYSDRFETLSPFCNICDLLDFRLPNCSGCTHLYGAFIEGIRRIETERAKLHAAALDSVRGLLVTVTDGHSTGEAPDMRAKAKQRVQAAAALPGQLGITTIAVAIGADADRAALEEVTGRRPFEVDDAKGFATLFDWVLKSLTRVAHSRETDGADYELYPIKEGE